MRKLSVIAFIIFLIFPSQAEDSSQFQIEGISIGDSALNYYSLQQINQASKYNCKNSSFKNCEMFQARMGPKGIYAGDIMLALKKNDPKFIIHGIAGIIPYKNNVKDCYAKQNKIISEIETILSNFTKREYEKAHSADRTGKSRNKSTVFTFTDSSRILVSCYDWSTEMKYYDNLRIEVKSSQFNNWLNNKAYK